MVATDTVVGIVGAVLLVAVMGSVFAYEYNNPATASGADSDAQQKANFLAHYPNLNATDDISGHGIPNYKNPDIDGDGVPNANDTTIDPTFKFGAPLAMAAAQPMTLADQKIPVGTGMVHFVAYVNYTAAFPSPAPTSPSLSAKLTGPGDTVTGVPTTKGTAVSIKIEVTTVMAPGSYTIHVEQTGASTGGSFTGIAVVLYDGGGAMPGMHM